MFIEFGYKNDGHSRPVCPSLRTKEDRNRRRPLPIGTGTDQGQRKAPRTDRTKSAPIQTSGAGSRRRKR